MRVDASWMAFRALRRVRRKLASFFCSLTCEDIRRSWQFATWKRALSLELNQAGSILVRKKKKSVVSEPHSLWYFVTVAETKTNTFILEQSLAYRMCVTKCEVSDSVASLRTIQNLYLVSICLLTLVSRN